jgi:hypothetical protein
LGRKIWNPLAATVGRKNLQAGRAQGIDGLFDWDFDRKRKVKDRSGGGANHLGVVDNYAAGGENDRVCASGICRAKHGSSVSRVSNLRKHGNQLGLGGNYLGQTHVYLLTDRYNALWSCGVAHGAQNVVANQYQVDASFFGALKEFRVALYAFWGRVKLDY